MLGMGTPFPRTAVNHEVYSASSLFLASVVGRAVLLEKSAVVHHNFLIAWLFTSCLAVFSLAQ